MRSLRVDQTKLSPKDRLGQYHSPNQSVVAVGASYKNFPKFCRVVACPRSKFPHSPRMLTSGVHSSINQKVNRLERSTGVRSLIWTPSGSGTQTFRQFIPTPLRQCRWEWPDGVCISISVTEN